MNSELVQNVIDALRLRDNLIIQRKSYGCLTVASQVLGAACIFAEIDKIKNSEGSSFYDHISRTGLEPAWVFPWEENLVVKTHR